MDFVAPDIKVFPLLPATIVAVTAMVVLLRGVLVPPERPQRGVAVSCVGLLVAALATLLQGFGPAGLSFAGMLVFDSATVLFYLVFLLATGLVVVLGSEHLKALGIEQSEATALILLSCVGMMLMASSGHLVMIFLGLETMSIALYILVGLAGSRDRGSNEAALKYLLLGGFATGFLVYGMAFVYGATGELEIHRIAAQIHVGNAIDSFLRVGLGLLVVGLGFKVALVPFHMWAPDVYEGAPTPVTAFMSVGPKLAGFAALIRVFVQGAEAAWADWLPILWVLAVATMFIGNVVAIAQTNLKRMLAYSSIAHAGYLLVGVASGSVLGVQAVLFYALAYTLMNLGAFAVVLAVSRGGNEGLQLDDYQGLWKRSPLLTATMALFMFALAGVPPFSGFIGKWLLFSAAVQAGQVSLAVLGVLCSAISAFYYLRIVVLMCMCDPVAEGDPLAGLPRTREVLLATAVGTLAIGFPLGFWFVHIAGWGAAGLV